MNISRTRYDFQPGKDVSVRHRGWKSAEVQMNYTRPSLKTAENNSIPVGGYKKNLPDVTDGFYPTNENGNVVLSGFDSENVAVRNPVLDETGTPVLESAKETVVLPGAEDVFLSTASGGVTGAVAGAAVFSALSIGAGLLDSVFNLVSVFPRSPAMMPTLAAGAAIGAAFGGSLGLAGGFLGSVGDYGREFKAEWNSVPINSKTFEGANATTHVQEVRLGTVGKIETEHLKFTPEYSEQQHGFYDKPSFEEVRSRSD